MKKIALIMAGGTGSKFWPRGIEKNPKQFIHLIGDGTMIQNTVMRLMPIFNPEDIYIITNGGLCDLAKDQLPLIPAENIIMEPFPRGTAPCIALTASLIRDKYPPDTVMAVFPSDHAILNVREFHISVETACQSAIDKSAIVTVGIMPLRPETAYGYIQVDDEMGDLDGLYDSGVRQTRTFAEKPDAATAKRFLDSGDFLWNSGIFIWSLDTFWASFKKYLPESYLLFEVLKSHIGKETYNEILEHVYRQMQSESVDYAILEKADNVLVVNSSFSWTDLGNWDELYRLSLKDARDNAIDGNVISLNISNCFISSHEKMIGIIGVDNLIVIDSKDATLICKRGCSDDVKELVDMMRRKNINMMI